ncbi:hypothetical protein I7I48_09792 [Histoplasma ohiense]|nr:hypothetical protein I7I48_09792 [Histoplasma ohiense (nom. inval.)]
MGNVQSGQPLHSQRRARRSNRLSKAPTSYPSNKLRSTLGQEPYVESPLWEYSPYSPYSSHNPWLDSQPVHSPALGSPTNGIISEGPSPPVSLRASHGPENQSTGDDGRPRSNFGEMMGEFKRRMSRSGSRTRVARFSHTPELGKLDARLAQPIPVGVSSVQMEEPERTFGLGVDGFPPLETHRFPSIRRLSLYSGKSRRSPKTLLQTIFSPRNTENDSPPFSYWGRDGHEPMRRTSADTFFLYEMTRSSPLRSSTPSDLEYSHLGRLKLGSLRVVNGSASPAPSDRVPMSVRRQSFSDMKSVHLDHHNSIDLLRSRSRDWADSCSSPNLPQGSYAPNSHLEPSLNSLKTPRIDRSKSPLMSEYGSPLESPSNGKPDACLPVFRLSWPNNPEAFLGISSVPGSIKDQPLDPATLTSLSHEPNQALLATSKPSEFYDILFNNESEELVQTRKNEPIEREWNDDPNRGRSMENSTRSSTGKEKGRKTYALTKADSGYSSASSNKSLHRHKSALTARADSKDEPAGQPNLISTGTTKAIEECNETSTSRSASRRRSLSATPPPVPRKDTPPVLKTPNLHHSRPRDEKIDQVLSPTAQTNASFSQRMARIRSLSNVAPKQASPATPILSPKPLDKGFRSFLNENTPERQQSSWLWNPSRSQHNPHKNFDAHYISPVDNHMNENLMQINRFKSAQTKKSTDRARITNQHLLQARRLHRPQSMVNLNDYTSDSEHDHQHRPQLHQPEKQQQSHGWVRSSFFQHRSRSNKRNTASGDGMNFFGHRRTGSKPTNNPKHAPKRNANLSTATESVRHHRNPSTTNLDRRLSPTPPEKHESVTRDNTTTPWVDSRSNHITTSNNRNAHYNNCDDNNAEDTHSASIFTGPFPLQNLRIDVKPKRSFLREVEGKRDPFFCVGFPQSQSQQHSSGT